MVPSKKYACKLTSLLKSKQTDKNSSSHVATYAFSTAKSQIIFFIISCAKPIYFSD
jgi:hypothetical protein